MEWPEVKRRLTKEGTSVQVLADLEGVPYKTMYNRIMQHQIKDGVTYLTPQNSKGLKRSEEMKTIKRKKSREAEKAQGLPEVVKEPDNIPEEVYTKNEDPRPLVPVTDPEREGLCPEVMEALQENYEICRKLSERYLRQANDYAHLLKRYGVDIPKAREEMMRKLPEVFK